VAWEQSSSAGHDLIVLAAVTSVGARTGEWLAWLGRDAAEISRLGQSINVPGDVGSFYLNYHYILESGQETCDPGIVSDFLEIYVDAALVARSSLCNVPDQPTWRLRKWSKIDLGQYAGNTIFLEIVVTNNDVAGTVTSIYIDDVFFSQ
jgi:hypothetical protein